MIAVIGDGHLADEDPKTTMARDIGAALVTAGYRVCSGGLGGVMAAASAGAHSSPAYREGDVVAIIPGLDASQANPHADIVIPTPLGHGRNAVVAAADAVVAVGGGAGTLSEISFAWAYGRLCIAMRVDGWSGKLADSRLDDKDRGIPDPDLVFGADTADEVIAVLAEHLPRYGKLTKDLLQTEGP